jgi:hypothetical protein
LSGDGARSGEDCFKKGGFSACEGTDDGNAFRSRASSSGATSHGAGLHSGVSQRAAAGLRPSQGVVFCHLPELIVPRVAVQGKGGVWKLMDPLSFDMSIVGGFNKPAAPVAKCR